MRLAFAGALLAVTLGSNVQAQTTAPAPTTCATLFDDIRGRVETDYVGYADAIVPNPRRLSAYRSLVDERRRRAHSSSLENCFFVMRGFIEWFGDPHLFLQETPSSSDGEIAAFRAAVPRINGDLSNAIARAQRAGHGIEGVWTSNRFDAAIISRDRAGVYAAIVTVPHDEHWSAGEVAATFSRNGDRFDATLFRTADRAPLHYEAVLERDGQMLHMPPLTWGRHSPSDMRVYAPFDPASPRAPSFALIGDSATLVQMASFSDSAPIAALELAHGAEIRARDLLILDLRGNEGGGSGAAVSLEPYFASIEQRPLLGPRTFPMALSSPRMIDYFQATIDRTPRGAYRTQLTALVERMRASPGHLASMFETPAAAEAAWSSSPPQTLYPMPTHVTVIVDRNSVSAAEAFAIDARRSTRVTLFGENTGGSIDYQNVAVFGFGDGRWSYALGLPTMAGSDQVREHGLNRTGVPVDVRLRPGADWIADVQRYYAQRR